MGRAVSTARGAVRSPTSDAIQSGVRQGEPTTKPQAESWLACFPAQWFSAGGDFDPREDIWLSHLRVQCYIY